MCTCREDFAPLTLTGATSSGCAAGWQTTEKRTQAECRAEIALSSVNTSGRRILRFAYTSWRGLRACGTCTVCQLGSKSFVFHKAHDVAYINPECRSARLGMRWAIWYCTIAFILRCQLQNGKGELKVTLICCDGLSLQRRRSIVCQLVLSVDAVTQFRCCHRFVRLWIIDIFIFWWVERSLNASLQVIVTLAAHRRHYGDI